VNKLSKYCFVFNDDIGGMFISVHLYTYGEGNGNPLQYSCPENSMDGGA